MSDLAVSVIIPTYNRARLITRALLSVCAAIAPGDEVIVVDDGSTDDTPRVLEPFGNRIRYVRGKHRGVGAARNLGIALASRPLIAFHDSDDEWVPDKLRLQRAFAAARPDVLFSFSDFGVRRESGVCENHHGLVRWHGDQRTWDEILGPGLPYSRFAPLPPGREDFRVHIGSLYPTLLRTNYVASPGVLVQRERAGTALRYAEDMSIQEDAECFVRLARKGLAAYFDCETFWQWGHGGPRLSAVDDAYWAECRIKMLTRTFGTDEEFLARHGDQYRATLQAEHLTLARCLIRDGRPEEARAELRLGGGGPLSYRVLSSLPGPVVRQLLALRRRWRPATAG